MYHNSILIPNSSVKKDEKNARLAQLKYEKLITIIILNTIKLTFNQS